MNQETLQALLGNEYLGNTIQAYLTAIILFVTVIAGLWLFQKIAISRLRALAEKTKTDIDDFFLGLFARLGILTYAFIALYLATKPLTLPAVVDQLITILFILGMTIKVVQMIEAIVLFFLNRVYGKAKAEDPTRATAIRNMTVVVRIALWAAGAVFILDNLGFEITGIVAGLGIGGIAVALAAQAVLGDAFSSFAIFMDRPFQVGDFVIIGDYLGVVENIGFKTTRIRSLGGEQLVFSNTDLTTTRIRNYKRMRERRVVFGLGAVYQTPLAKMQKIPGLIRDIISDIEGTRFDRAHFKEFGDFSLNIEAVYYVLSPDYNKYMDIQQEINLKIMAAFEREGIEFAYPTQTVFLSREGNGSAESPPYGRAAP